jgi:hypothetical protein
MFSVRFHSSSIASTIMTHRLKRYLTSFWGVA